MLASRVVPKFVNGSTTAVAIKSLVSLMYAFTEPLNLILEKEKSIPTFVVWPTSHLKSLLIGSGLYVV